MRKQFGRLFLYIMMLVLMSNLTGCSEVETGINITDANTVSDSTSFDKSKPTGQGGLVWYMFGNRQEPDLSIVLDEVNKILQDKINTTLDLQIFPTEDEYLQKVNTALASNDPPDIVFSSKGLVDYHANSKAGNFKKLDIYLLKYPTLNSIIDNKYLDYFRINGDLYGIPAMKKNAHNRGVMLREDLVHKYGMDLDQITTLESLEPYLEIIRENELQVIPLAVAGMDFSFGLIDWDFIIDETVPGALYPDNRGDEIVNQFLAPESIEYYKLMRRWSINGYMHKDAATMQNTLELLKSKMFFAAIHTLSPGKDAEISEHTGIGWVQVDMSEPVTTNEDILDAILAIPSGSKNPDKAFLFIELLYTDSDIKNLLDHGIENVHYTMVNENTISYPEPQDSGYKPGFGDRFGNMFLSYISDREDPLKYEKILEYNRKSKALHSLGFAFDHSDVEIQIRACGSVVSAYSSMLFTGSCDIDSTIEQFRKELRAAGVEDLLMEMQYQYDTWRSSR
jgi:putative aldouronate transport system substrate-binding protein